jgi:uncharacterized protein YaaR (DUF327 family)
MAEITNLNVVEKTLDELAEKLQGFQDSIENCSDCIEERIITGKLRQSVKGLKKNQRLEKTRAFLKKNYPKTFTLLEDIDDFLFAIQDTVGDIENSATSAIESIGEVEGLLEEVEQAKRRI